MSARPRVLLVDDLETNLFLQQEVLGGLDIEILTAIDGPSALAIVRESHPDVVVIDFQMPAMSGAETSRRIKQNALPFTFVILTSGYRELEESTSFRDSLADRFLAKPYGLEQLRASVEDGLRIALEHRA